jgi:hypothetical protein
MPDNVNDENSTTGEMPRVVIEPPMVVEPTVPTKAKLKIPTIEPSTGMMRIISEARDDTAERDEDKPSQ